MEICCCVVVCGRRRKWIGLLRKAEDEDVRLDNDVVVVVVTLLYNLYFIGAALFIRHYRYH